MNQERLNCIWMHGWLDGWVGVYDGLEITYGDGSRACMDDLLMTQIVNKFH